MTSSHPFDRFLATLLGLAGLGAALVGEHDPARRLVLVLLGLSALARATARPRPAAGLLVLSGVTLAVRGTLLIAEQGWASGVFDLLLGGALALLGVRGDEAPRL